ncbi:MAG: winged helix-turn-helix domain-containing protein [Acidobacteriota bacterium]
MNGFECHSYRFDSFLLNVGERQLFFSDKLVSLTPKAFDVLTILVANAGHLVLKDDLMKAVWTDSFVDEVNLPRTIHTLRRLLGEDQNGHKFIETVPTKGYRFVAGVRLVDDEDGGSANTNLSLDVKTNDVTAAASLLAPVRRRWQSPAVLVAVAAVLVAGIVGSYLLFATRNAVGNGGRRSVAVLPFDNSTSDPNQDYLVDGMTENVIDNLSRLSGLKVTSRSAVFNYRGKMSDLGKVAAELGVDAIITGDIKQFGDQVIININLVDASGRSVIWGKQFIKNRLDAVATPNEIAQAVAENLRVNLTDSDRRSLGKLPTENEEAYRLFLKGRKLAQVSTPENLNGSINYYRQAIEKDPNFAVAYSDMGMRYASLGIYFGPPREVMPKAKDAALKALAIDETLSDPHTILGLVALLYDWDWDKAKEELAEGSFVNLRSIEMFNCSAHVLQVTGRAVDADGSLRSALKSDPLSISLATELGCNSYYAGRFDESISEYRDALVLAPDNFMALYGLARSLNHKKQYQEAIDELDKAKEFMPMLPPIAVAEMAYANAKLGRRDEVEKSLKTLDSLPHEVYVDPFFIAVIYSSLDDKDKTFEWLEKAYQARSSLMPTLVNDPKWDGLRSDPRFQDLLPKIGFTRQKPV